MILARKDHFMSTNEKGTPQSSTYAVSDIVAILDIGCVSACKLANSGLFETIRIGNMIHISRRQFNIVAYINGSSFFNWKYRQKIYQVWRFPDATLCEPHLILLLYEPAVLRHPLFGILHAPLSRLNNVEDLLGG